MRKIILASGSPRRKMILDLLGLKFDIVVSRVDEKLNPGFVLRTQPAYLSRLKASAVAKKYKDAIIIGADSMVLSGTSILGKPKGQNDAKKMLRSLSGTTHSIITGYTIIDSKTKKSITKSVETKIWFRKLTWSEIDSYIKLERPFDKAGAYAIQGIASIFIKKIEGDYFAAVGLPIYSIVKDLKKFGVEIL